MMLGILQKAALKTLIYSDIFDYPLKVEEIGKWLIGVSLPAGKAGMKNLEFRTQNLKNIQEKNGYYFLKGRERIADLRAERKIFSQKKLAIAEKCGNIIRIVPSVKLIGITGALSMNNAKKNDDIDLFIITSKGLLWTTRFIVTLLVEFTGMRRHPNERNVTNRVCLNMFIDEDHLEIPKNEKDLFSAHEVLQMKPLFDKDNTYQKFIRINGWVKRYLPNAYRERTLKERDKDTSDGGEASTSTPPRWRRQKSALRIFEIFLKKFQLWYMKNRRTTEVIKNEVIRFHPHDARKWVMKKYKEKNA